MNVLILPTVYHVNLVVIILTAIKLLVLNVTKEHLESKTVICCYFVVIVVIIIIIGVNLVIVRGGEAQCQDCPVGTFANETGLSSCLPCSLG